MQQKMKIDWVRPFCFRSFGECDPIEIEDGLTIVFGANGSGKSSLAEAIEWLFFGHTARRLKGDSFSKDEYRGSYVRNMTRPACPPFVEARLRFGESGTLLIRRNMIIPESGRLDDTKSELVIVESKGPIADPEFLHLQCTIQSWLSTPFRTSSMFDRSIDIELCPMLWALQRSSSSRMLWILREHRTELVHLDPSLRPRRSPTFGCRPSHTESSEYCRQLERRQVQPR